MNSFKKTGLLGDGGSPMGLPCVVCNCETIVCDSWEFAYAVQILVGIQENNWRHPGVGDEYNNISDPGI